MIEHPVARNVAGVLDGEIRRARVVPIELRLVRRPNNPIRMKVPYCATVGKSKRRANTVSAGKRSMNRGRSLRRSVLRYPFHDVHLATRSEEHTSELQSRVDLVCRL